MLFIVAFTFLTHNIIMLGSPFPSSSPSRCIFGPRDLCHLTLSIIIMRSVLKKKIVIKESFSIFYKKPCTFLGITLTVARSVFRDLIVTPEPPEKDRSKTLPGSMRTKTKHAKNLDLFKILL